MSFPLDEVDDDIILEQYTTDVADEDPDPIRARGSVHRGAAYLQEMSYPPGGASGGQEGGSMRPVEEVEVFGEDEFDDAFDYVDPDARAANIEALEGDDDVDDLADVMADLVNDEMASAMLRPAAPIVEAAKPPIAVAGNLGDSDSAYCHGLDVLGAGITTRTKISPRMGSVLKIAPNGNQYLSKQVGKVKVGDYKSTLRNARDMGQHAIDIGKRLADVLKQRAAAPRRVVAKGTKVHGLAASSKKSGAGNRITPAQAMKLAKNAHDTGTKVLAAAKKFADVLDANAAKQDAARQALAVKMNKRKAFAKMAASAAPGTAGMATAAAPRTAAAARSTVATKLRGDYLDDVNDFLGAYADTLSEELAYDMFLGLGETGPLPEDPSATPTDPSLTDPNASVTVDDSDLAFMDPGAMPTVAPPPEDFETYTPWTTTPFSSTARPGCAPIPRGAIIFTNVKALGNGSGGVGADRGSNQANVGSMNRFLSNIPGAVHDMDSGYEYSGDGWQTYHANRSKGYQYSGTNDGEVKDLQANSIAQNWGPLIGNPYHPTFKNLHFDDIDGDVRNGRWFWFYGEAPAEARAPGDAERLNQALTDWHAAKAAYDAEIANRALQAFLDAEEAKKTLQAQAKADAASTFQQEQEQKAATSQAAAQETLDQQQLAVTQQLEQATTAEQEQRGQLDEERYARTSEQDVANTERLAEKEAALAEQAAQADYERYMAMAAQQGAAAPVPEAEDLDASQSVLVETPLDDGNLSDYADLTPESDEGSVESAESVLGDVIPNYTRGSDRLRTKRQDR
jgi:hypothetical protein